MDGWQKVDHSRREKEPHLRYRTNMSGLSARFCADAIHALTLRNRTLFPEIGYHNLQRARTQFKLAQSVNAQKSDAERIISTI